MTNIWNFMALLAESVRKIIKQQKVMQDNYLLKKWTKLEENNYLRTLRTLW